MKLNVDFYADGFRNIQLEVDDKIHQMLPKCKCNLFRQGHYCERGRMVERYVRKVLMENNIIQYPEIITCKIV